eukprot:10033889-Alexandrium_andersonii.AAC.1
MGASHTATLATDEGSGTAGDAIRSLRANPEFTAMSEDGSLLDTAEDPYEALARVDMAEDGLTDQVLSEARAEASTGVPRLDTLGRATSADGGAGSTARLEA